MFSIGKIKAFFRRVYVGYCVYGDDNPDVAWDACEDEIVHLTEVFGLDVDDVRTLEEYLGEVDMAYRQYYEKKKEREA